MGNELRHLGVDFRETPDGFAILGGRPIRGGQADSHGDHRLAMSLALVGLASQSPVQVSGASVIHEIFPRIYRAVKIHWGRMPAWLVLEHADETSTCCLCPRLIGYPLEKSLSPQLHTATLKALNLEGEYRLYPTPPAPEGDPDLANLVNRLRIGELHGLNVTIPHKRTITAHLDRLTPLAEEIGAVNTIYLEDGHAVGDNTDAPGFLLDLERLTGLPTFRDGDAPSLVMRSCLEAEELPGR